MEKTDRYIAMKGAGYYSRATIGAKHVMDNAVDLILDALNRLPPLDDGTVFEMTDMGCADGGTSIDMVGRVLEDVRARCPSRPIRITYTDLPRNDFSQLFRIVHGLTGIETYAARLDNLYVNASATSFHRQIVPDGTLDLGHSSTASHYITASPCPIPDHVHMVGATGQVRQDWEDKGAQDWENFLFLRTQELKPGGVLALFNFGIDEAGRYLGHTGGVSMFDTFNRLWREMTEDGTISEAEYLGTNFPQVYRTLEQFCAPLNDTEGRVYKAGLRLEVAENRLVPCPFAADFHENGNAAEFAKAYIPTLRSWSEPVFVAGLSSSRSDDEKARIVDAFYSRYQDLVATSPDGHAMDYVHCYMVCRKV